MAVAPSGEYQSSLYLSLCMFFNFAANVSSMSFASSLASISFHFVSLSLLIIIIIMAGMAVFYVAGYLMEERLMSRWPVITASPRGSYSS